MNELDLKRTLFVHAKAELRAYRCSARCLGDDAPETRKQHARFCGVWDIIEEHGLVDEYEAWIKEHGE